MANYNDTIGATEVGYDNVNAGSNSGPASPLEAEAQLSDFDPVLVDAAKDLHGQGITSLKGARKALRKAKFTLIELLVVVSIISILAGMLLPVLTKAREKARQASCLSNMKQVEIATKMYEDEQEGYLPYTDDADSDVLEFNAPWKLFLLNDVGNLKSKEVHQDPSKKIDLSELGEPYDSRVSTRYWYFGPSSGLPLKSERAKDPSAEPHYACKYYNILAGTDITNHPQLINVPYLDGHAEPKKVPLFWRINAATARDEIKNNAFVENP